LPQAQQARTVAPSGSQEALALE